MQSDVPRPSEVDMTSGDALPAGMSTCSVVQTAQCGQHRYPLTLHGRPWWWPGQWRRCRLLLLPMQWLLLRMEWLRNRWLKVRPAQLQLWLQMWR